MTDTQDNIHNFFSAFEKLNLGTPLFLSILPLKIGGFSENDNEVDYLGVYVDTKLDSLAFLKTKSVLKRKIINNIPFYEIGHFIDELLKGNVLFLEALISQMQVRNTSDRKCNMFLVEKLLNRYMDFVNKNLNVWLSNDISKRIKKGLSVEDYRRYSRLLVKLAHLNDEPNASLILNATSDYIDIVRMASYLPKVIDEAIQIETFALDVANLHDSVKTVFEGMYQVFAQSTETSKLPTVPINPVKIKKELVKFRLSLME